MKKGKYIILGVAIFLVVLAVALLNSFFPAVRSLVQPKKVLLTSPSYQKPESERQIADWIVVGAKEEVAQRVRYDASYQMLAYPAGDVNRHVGACTDVVIRALRRAGYDLQQLVHEDIMNRSGSYERQSSLKAPDANIDHRRVVNLMVFFAQNGQVLPNECLGAAKASWHPGDIVCWKMPTGRLHTGIVSDRYNRKGIPMVIHNAFITIEDDALVRWKVIGHYRFPRS